MRVKELETFLSTLNSDSDTDSEAWGDIFPPSVGVELGNCGIILALLETPSGFALFSCDGFPLRLPRAIENVWADFMVGSLAAKAARLVSFQPFEDKTSAIHADTGVNERLAMMILNKIVPGQKLAVGKLEYQKIIENKLKIECLFDDIVMELMWGLKNCMHHLVPDEKEQLAKEDRRYMSKGMKIALDRYELKVEPEMVNEKMVQMTGVVYNCDLWEDKYSESLRAAGKHLEAISGIDSQDWDLFKLAAALKIICFPKEELPGNSLEIFSKAEYSKLLEDAHQYDNKLSKPHCKFIFEELLNAGLLRKKVLGGLAHCVNEARKAYEAGQGLMGSS
ncbi:hypothetical protein BS78_01G215200 [Paspalum vaginatum]|nr:hypothetical protein BS78_01G215200 [Paspalum vaginatum]